MEVLNCEKTNFWSFCLLWPWPRPDDLHIRTALETHRMCENKRFTSILSKVIVLRAANVCIVWSLAVTWQRLRNTAVVENPTLHANLMMAVSCIEPELWTIEVDIAGIDILDVLAPVTMTLTQWPSVTNLTRIAWSYIECANMNFLRQGFRKLSSDRQTESIEIVKHAASPVHM